MIWSLIGAIVFLICGWTLMLGMLRRHAALLDLLSERVTRMESGQAYVARRIYRLEERRRDGH